MISKKDIERLAELSRLKLTVEETAAFEKDFTSILEYVGQVSAVDVDALQEEKPAIRNVMREDVAVPFAVGSSRDALLKAMPERDGDYLLVRKVIKNKKK